MEQMEIFPVRKKEVAQHNNLIFAPFALGSLESKIFISMLERVDRYSEDLPEWPIPVKEIIKHSNGANYEELEKAAKTLTSHSVDIAPADPKKPYRKGFDYKALVITCKHVNGAGYLRCQFHPHIKEYLVNLLGHYTRADLAVLKKFRDERAVRFYWMLKARFYSTDEVQITVEECRQALLPKGSTSYEYPNDFKKYILDKVIKPEIDKTDVAYRYGEPVKKGNKTIAWSFIREEGAVTVVPEAPLPLSSKLVERLEEIPIDEKGIRLIGQMLGQQVKGQEVTEDYINFVIYYLKTDSATNPSKYSKPLGGYIINHVVDGRLAKKYKAKLG
jgi:plasmid replication initiation protein